MSLGTSYIWLSPCDGARHNMSCWEDEQEGFDLDWDIMNLAYMPQFVDLIGAELGHMWTDIEGYTPDEVKRSIDEEAEEIYHAWVELEGQKRNSNTKDK